MGIELVIASHDFDLAAISLPYNDSGQSVCRHVPLSPSSIVWYWPKGGSRYVVVK